MYICSNNECNQYREPCSSRGFINGAFSSSFSNAFAVLVSALYTCSSVQGTGPGAACPKPVETTETPKIVAKKVCKITINSRNRLSSKSNNKNSIKVC